MLGPPNEVAGFRSAPRRYNEAMERPDLYQDDLTEERYPSPEKRDDVASQETLDPDTLGDDDDAAVADPHGDDGRG